MILQLATRNKLAGAGILAAGLAIAVKLVRRLARRGAPGQDVPYAKGYLPVIGHLPFIRRHIKQKVSQKLMEGRIAMDVQQEEGLDIFALGFCLGKVIVILDPDLAADVCKGEPHFTKNLNISDSDVMLQAFGEGLFFAASHDPRWSIMHNVLKAPFSTVGVKDLTPAMCEQADKLVKALKRDVGYGGSTYIDGWVAKMAFETISVCGMGMPLGSFDDDKQPRFLTALDGIINNLNPLLFCPKPLRSILMPKKWKEFTENCNFTRGVCLDAIRKRREQTTSRAGNRKDILDMMLNDKDPQSGQHMTDHMIVDNVMTFLFAGQDSTAAAMGSMICLLCEHTDCKAKLLKEIDEVVGQGPLEWEHLGKLQYLDWCMKETMRVVPPASSFFRQTKGDQLVGGKWRIPDGTTIVLSIFGFHYNKKVWGEDVNEFRPERWQHGPPHKYAFLPFAVGPRACLGREFTVIEQKITMVKLFQHFDFQRSSVVKPPRDGYSTLERKEAAVLPPFIDLDVELKTTDAFTGLTAEFELLERKR